MDLMSQATAMKKKRLTENKSGWLVGSGVVAAMGASLCCIGPLIFTLLGVSGAAALTKFSVLRVPMIFIVILVFGVAGFSLYKKRDICEPGSPCVDPKKYRLMQWIYWTGLVISALGVSSPYWVIWILD